ncbi:MAG: hypothetical protein HYY88_03570 [candidate division NC10 bacterium]|nr:hypothetical protein [candidate division NC10 bacterium]
MQDVQGRIHPGAGRREPLDEVGGKAVAAVGFREDAVKDHVYVGVKTVDDGLPAGAVGRRQLAVAVRLVGDRPELLDGVGCPFRVGGSRAPTAGDDLDVVGALLEELPDLGPNGDLAVSLRTEVVQVAAGHGDRPPADHHPRSDRQDLPDSLSQREGDPVLGAVLAHGRDAGVEHRAGVLGGAKEQDVIVLHGDIVANRPVAGREQVGVGVHQSGKDGRVAVIDPVDGPALRRGEIGLAADVGNAPILDQQGRPLEGGSATAVQQAGGGEQDEPCRRSGHGLDLLREYDVCGWRPRPGRSRGDGTL